MQLIPRKPNERKRAATALLAVFMAVTTLGGIGAPQTARAFPVEDLITEANTSIMAVGEQINQNLTTAAATAVVGAANYFLTQIAYSAAVAVTSDCPGQGPCFNTKVFNEGFKQAWQGAIGEAVGTLSQELGWGDFLCAPNASLSLVLQLGIINELQPEPPACDFNDITANWTNAVNSLSNTELSDIVRVQFQPGQSELSATLIMYDSVTNDRREEDELAAIMERLESAGSGGFTAVRDVVSDRNVAPPAATAEQYRQAEAARTGQPIETVGQVTAGEVARGAIAGIVLNMTSVFAQTLASRLLNKLAEGLLSAEEAIEAQPDLVLSREGILNPPGRRGAERAAAARTRSTAQLAPREIAEIDPLIDFTACPSQNTTQWNCVMDTGFATAVRAAAHEPLTVQEAIDQGYLHGEWPMVSDIHDAAAANDRNCYTRGYCVPNLKILRAFRVISAGWEMAAADVWGNGQFPPTLQQVVDGFDDCNSSGGIDEQHPYCHLINPDWVLKMPATQCRQEAYGPQLLTPDIPTRVTQCTDFVQCLGTDDTGACDKGYGYCMLEENIWRFRGDECPAQYATCTSYTSTSGTSGSFLSNTISGGVCTADNAGCTMYSLQRRLPPFDTTEPFDDYVYGFGYLSQRYFDRDAKPCSPSDDGCTALRPLRAGESLNLVRNGGFDDLEDKDLDGTPESPRHWDQPNGSLPSTMTGFMSADGSKSASGLVAAYLAGDTLIAGNGAIINNPAMCINALGCQDPAGCRCDGDDNTAFGNRACGIGYKGFWCSSLNAVRQGGIPIVPGTTYAMSARFAPESASSSFTGRMRLRFYGADGAHVRIGSLPYVVSVTSDGTPTTLTCAAGGTGGEYLELRATQAGADGAIVPLCTFAINLPPGNFPEMPYHVMLDIVGSNAWVDDVIIEQGYGTDFHEDSNATAPLTYAKVAPTWLGCTGDASDHPDCAKYAQVCRESEIGCSAYTPTNGDPMVPGIVSPEDACPAECVGYDTFKQERSNFDLEKFPVYFIPTTAQQCTAAEAGCTEFTNMATEARRYFTEIRICQQPGAGDTEPFYTWEGSDAAGYQLRVWQLKRSNLAATQSAGADPTDLSVAGTPGAAGRAPCTKLSVDSQNACVDAQSDGYCTAADIAAGSFDCREFYDADGNRHFRLLSKTIQESTSCEDYRITSVSRDDCEIANGRWDGTLQQCVYAIDPSLSRECGAGANGCRAYAGNASGNIRTLFEDDFESGFNFGGFESGDGWADQGSAATGLSHSSEALTVGGHSLSVAVRSIGGVDRRVVLRDVSKHVEPGRSYMVRFWARGTGSVEARFIHVQNTSRNSCTVPSGCTGDACTCTLESGLVCTRSSPGTCTLPTPPAAPADPGLRQFAYASDIPSTPEAEPTVALTSEWKEYSLGPVVFDPTNAAFSWPQRIQLWIGDATDQASSITPFFIDNVRFDTVEDSIYVVRDTWSTPASCDMTHSGLPSPREMLGCREYTTADNAAVTLRSFTQLCRENAIGCAAYLDLQDTPDDPYERSFNNLCSMDSPGTTAIERCTPMPGELTCPCRMDVSTLTPQFSTGIEWDYGSPTTFGDGKTETLWNVCQIPAGASSCRFEHDARLPASAQAPYVNYPIHHGTVRPTCRLQDACSASTPGAIELVPGSGDYACGCTEPELGFCWVAEGSDWCSATNDTVVVNADQRRFLVVGEGDRCNASAASCKAAAKPETTNEGVCRYESPCAPGVGFYDPTTAACACVGVGPGNVFDGVCQILEGEDSCTYQRINGAGITSWESGAFKDDPAAYATSLCTSDALSCEEWRGSDGTAYFKDPEDRTCEYKENIDFRDPTTGFVAKRSGWFRVSESGDLFPCAAELLKNGTEFGIYRNSDVSCTLDAYCGDPAGCDCTGADYRVCRVPYAQLTCGYQGWIGSCEAKYDSCTEFVDHFDTSHEHPEGEPYYFLDNNRLQEGECDGKASLTEGCVVFDDTSDPRKSMNSRATYASSEYKFQGQPIAPVDCVANPSHEFCQRVCYWQDRGFCSDTGAPCAIDSQCTAGATCSGIPTYGGACRTAADCGGAATCELPPAGPVYNSIKKNDGNRVLKVSRDRECAQWLEQSSCSTVTDAATGEKISRCASVELCEERVPTATGFLCSEPVDTSSMLYRLFPFNGLWYASWPRNWNSLEATGYAVPNRFVAPVLEAVDVTPGFCKDASGGQIGSGFSCLNDGDCWTSFGNSSFCSAPRAGICSIPLPCSAGSCSVACDDDATCQSQNRGYCDTSDVKTIRYGMRAREFYGECQTSSQCGHFFMGQGLCVHGDCMWGASAGWLDPYSTLNMIQCRAYPEKDAPYPNSILSSQNPVGYAAQRQSAFASANVCMPGESCDCSYTRLGVGSSGGQSLFFGMDTALNSLQGICQGGPLSGYPCIYSSTTNSCGEGGSCQIGSRITRGFGQVGFCLDYDLSTPINGIANSAGTAQQYACNLWLPVDHVNGSLDAYDQHPEAAYQMPPGVDNLLYCSAAEGNDAGNTYAKMVWDDGSIGDWDEQLFAHNDGSDDHTDVTQDLPSYSVIPADAITSISVELLGANNSDDAGVPMRLWLDAGNSWKQGVGLDVGDPGREITDMKRDGQQIYTSGSTSGWEVCRSSSALSHDACDNDCDDDNECDCIAVEAVFSGGYLTRLHSLLCHDNSGDQELHPEVRVTAYMSEECSEFTHAYTSTTKVRANALWADANLGHMGGNTLFQYTHDTVEWALTSKTLVPFGPYSDTGPDAVASLPNGRKVPIVAADLGSDFLFSQGGAPPALGDGSAINYRVAGYPLSCVGPCYFGVPSNTGSVANAGNQVRANFLNRYFATIEGAYLWNGSTYAATDITGANVDRGNGYDNRENLVSVGDAIKVNPVDPRTCTTVTCNEIPNFPGGSMTVGEKYGPGEEVCAVGELRVPIRYFAHTASDRMPIRAKYFDFGYGTAGDVIKRQGFFRNQVGRYPGGGGCDGSEYGLIKDQTCDERYYEEQGVYRCFPDLYDGLPTCGTETSYPCRGSDTDGNYCEFKPRVMFIDEWETCNGVCPGPPGIGNLCAEFPSISTEDVEEECDYSVLDDDTNYLAADRPWTAFQGVIRVYLVEPESNLPLSSACQ